MISFTQFLTWVRNYRTNYSKTQTKTAFNNLKEAYPRTWHKWLSTCECGDSVFKPNKNFEISYSKVTKSIGKKNGMLCSSCEFCKHCCDCYKCHNCGLLKNPTNTPKCHNCGSCFNCCNCYVCNNCNARCNNICDDCTRCDDCCECDEECEHMEFFQHRGDPVFHVANKREFQKNPSKRFIAVEIEVAGLKQKLQSKHDAVRDVVKGYHGSIVHDGSLPATGFEINTSPANGDRFINQVDEIAKALSDGDSYVNINCGLHVHVDARDYDYYALRRLVNYYAKIEPALYAIVAKNRRKNRYCLPCGDKYTSDMVLGGALPKQSVKYNIIKGLYGQCNKSINNLKRDKYSPSRYNALNIHSWFYRGTIECRMFEGTVDPYEIKCWGMLWAFILDFAYSSSEKDINNLDKTKPIENLILSFEKRGNAEVAEFVAKRLVSNGKTTDGKTLTRLEQLPY